MQPSFTKFFALSGGIFLTSCAAPHQFEGAATSPIIATNLPAETSQQATSSDGISNIPGEKPLNAPDTHISANPTLSQVLKRALLRHPEIKAAGFEQLARQAEVQQASRLPNPEIATELENFAGNGGFSGFEGSETTVAVTQRIELGNKRKRRTDEAIQNTRVASFELETKRLEIFQNTARRFYEALAAQEEVKVASDLLRSAERLEKSVSVSVRAGKANILEQQQATLILNRSRIVREQANARKRSSLKSLAAVIGVPPNKITSVSGDLFNVTLPLPEQTLRQHLETTPRAARAAAEVARRRASLATARAGRIPDLSLTGGARFDQESNDRAFVASIGLPLPVFNRNEGTIAAAEARVNQGIFDQQAQSINLETLFSDRYSTLVIVAQQTITFKNKLIPAARTNFQTTSRAYDRGSVNLVTLITSQQTLSELELETVRSAVQYHLTRIELEGLLGHGVTSTQTTR